MTTRGRVRGRAEAMEIRCALLVGLARRTYSVSQHDDVAGARLAGLGAGRSEAPQRDIERSRCAESVGRGGGWVVGCAVAEVPTVLADACGDDGLELDGEGSRAATGRQVWIGREAVHHGEVHGQWQRADIGRRGHVWGRAVRSRVRDGRGTAPTGGKQQEKQDTPAHTSLRSRRKYGGGRGVSNPQPSEPQSDALPLSYVHRNPFAGKRTYAARSAQSSSAEAR